MIVAKQRSPIHRIPMYYRHRTRFVKRLVQKTAVIRNLSRRRDSCPLNACAFAVT